MKTVIRFMKANASPLLTATAIAGSISAVVLAVRATPKAVRLIEAKKKAEGKRTLTKREIVKTTWRVYVPAATSLVMSASCMVASTVHSERRRAAFAALYTMSEKTAQLYKAKVIEDYGEEAHNKITEHVHHRLEEDSNAPQPLVIGDGEVLCFDAFSGRYFSSDMESLRAAENDVNSAIWKRPYNEVSLNDFYDILNKKGDLPPIRAGEELGWDADNICELSFSSKVNERGRPCLVVGFASSPISTRDRRKF